MPFFNKTNKFIIYILEVVVLQKGAPKEEPITN